MTNALTWVLSGIVLSLTVIWMVHTVRQATIARRGPTVNLQSYLRHDRATAAVAACVAISLCIVLAVITRQHPLPIWPGAIAGVLVIIAGERRWPGPSGAIRSATVSQRRGRDLIPWFSCGIAAMALTAAGLVIGACWVLADSPAGRSISGTVEATDSATTATVASVDGFPGWPIGVITVLGGAALLATGAVGWHVVAARAALPTVSSALDRQFRRASVDRMVRIVAIAALVTTAEWFETARAKYEELHRLTHPLSMPSNSSYSWIQGACALLILIVFVTGTRPRLVGSPSATVDQPA